MLTQILTTLAVVLWGVVILRMRSKFTQAAVGNRSNGDDWIIVHRAKWGPVNSSQPDEYKDVTDVVQRNVHGTEIDLPVTIGSLTDPNPGLLKQLIVYYSFGKREVLLEQLPPLEPLLLRITAGGEKSG